MMKVVFEAANRLWRVARDNLLLGSQKTDEGLTGTLLWKVLKVVPDKSDIFIVFAPSDFLHFYRSHFSGVQ